MLVSSLAAFTGTVGASSSSGYRLVGYAEQPGGVAPVPAGVTVYLTSQASPSTVYSTTTTSGGQFVFNAANTAGNLGPGWWGVWAPIRTNVSLTGCSPCAVLSNATPIYSYQSAANLSSTSNQITIPNVAILAYNATLSGVTYSGSQVAGGALVQLLAPTYNDLVLNQARTNTTTGAFSFPVPYGSWVLRTTLSGPTTYYNTTAVTVQSPTVTVRPVVQRYMITGFMNIAGTSTHVPTPGNVTLYDPLDNYIYSFPTPPGGFYSVPTYPKGFNFTTAGSQPFVVILSAIGYQTTSYMVHVTANSALYRNVQMVPMAAADVAHYVTTIDLAGFNPLKGDGTTNVTTDAFLGNQTVLPSLGNASVGQLWAQLGLDLNHSLSLSSSQLPALYRFLAAQGPFFPAIQAGLSINGTGFVQSSPLSQNALTNTSTCSGVCSLDSSASINYSWAGQYSLNGTTALNSSQYTLSFTYHGSGSSVATNNYTVILPQGYVLAAGTPAPTSTRLLPVGTGGTWTAFTLVTSASAASGTIQLPMVRYSAPSANVNVSVNNFAFSSKNVLNQTHGNYTVVVGVGQAVAFSALNSSYPAGTNGTKFVWNFGDNTSTVTTTTATTHHTYSVATTGATPYTGWLNITSSGGLTANVTFHVWVVAPGQVSAGIATNATASMIHPGYLLLNWSTLLQINATTSHAVTSPGAPRIPGVLSVAYFVVQSSNNKITANYSVAKGAKFGTNLTIAFGQSPPPGRYLNSTVINGTTIPFLGWRYDVNLTVWNGVGESNTTTLVVLVNDSQPPVSKFQLLDQSGKPVPASGLIGSGANFSAVVQFNAANSTDPNNGTIVSYSWNITNPSSRTWNNGSRIMFINVTTVKPYPRVALPAEIKPYSINLTVRDLNNKSASSTQTLSVSINATTSPIMAANNLTGPVSLTQGSSYTFWVNVTAGGGAKSVARNVTVWWYTLPPNGIGTKNTVVTNSSVVFYNYTKGIVSPVAWRTPVPGVIPALSYNTTVRAQITWSPSSSGNFYLYANVTASNEYAGSYGTQNVAVLSISVAPSPTNLYLTYGAIAAVVIVIFVGIFFLWRRRTRGGSSSMVGKGKGSSTGGSRLEKGKRDDA
ncbi:MAG: hypothetical protein ACYCPN_02245 [Thermoplasmata archaeon]